MTDWKEKEKRLRKDFLKDQRKIRHIGLKRNSLQEKERVQIINSYQKEQKDEWGSKIKRMVRSTMRKLVTLAWSHFKVRGVYRTDKILLVQTSHKWCFCLKSRRGRHVYLKRGCVFKKLFTKVRKTTFEILAQMIQ